MYAIRSYYALAEIFSHRMGYGETGIWWSVPVAWLTGLIGACIYYLTGKWKGKVVTHNATS